MARSPAPQDARRSLLERAFDHFAAHGFHGASMRSLSRHLRVTTGTLYHYFAGKADLFAQMVLLRAETDARQLLDCVRPADSTRERIRALARFLEGRRRYFQKALFLMMDAYRSRSKRDGIGGVFPRALEIYGAALGRLFGSLPPRGTRAILAQLIGSVTLDLIQPAPGPQDESDTLESFFETWTAALGEEGTR